MKIPKTLGLCADKLLELREAKSALQKQIDGLEENEKALKDHLIENLSANDSTGVLGKRCRAAITVKTVATVKDWDQLYKLILKTKDFSLLQRRVGDAAVRERWEAGETVAGVEPFLVKQVSVTKI
jgi:hypothetical protein